MRRIYFALVATAVFLPLLAQAQTANYLVVEKDPDHKIFYFVKTGADLQTVQGLKSFDQLAKTAWVSANAFVPDPKDFPLDGIEVKMNHCGPTSWDEVQQKIALIIAELQERQRARLQEEQKKALGKKQPYTGCPAFVSDQVIPDLKSIKKLSKISVIENPTVFISDPSEFFWHLVLSSPN